MRRLIPPQAQYLVLGLLLCFLAACSHAPLMPDANDPAELPRRVELESVPFYPQQAYQCAPAALATMLNHLGVTFTPEQISPYVYLPARKGSIAPEVIAFARGQGLLTYPLEDGLSQLLREIAAGHPVLVLQNLSFDWLPQWHYAVVIGYDLDRREIILRSAKERRWVTSFTAFENTWKRSSHWAIVILPPDRLPATAAPIPLIEAAHDLEILGKLDAAEAVYLSTYRAWPDERILLLALGNFYYLQQRYQQAHPLFTKLTRLYPADTDGWNNHAYNLMQLGCRVQAVQAIERALQLAPEDENLLSSKRDIQGHAGSASCRLTATGQFR